MNPHLKAQLIHVLEASQHFGAKGAEAHWRENFPNCAGISAL